MEIGGAERWLIFATVVLSRMFAQTYADFKDDIDSILTIPQPSNEPLTLEELWEMNEEPVWVQNLEEPGKSQWRLLYWDRGKHLVL